MHFHPIVSLRKQEIVAYEALGRAFLHNREVVGAGKLFDDARAMGLGLDLDRLFRKLAMDHFTRHRGHLGAALLSLNFDTRNIDLGVVGSGQLIALAEKYTIDPQNVIIEILESRVKDTEALQRFIRQYKDYGFLIAIDDIGSGYSNLDRLFLIQPDIIKIDAGLIRNINREYYKQVMVESLTNLAHKIGALVVAEGVENEEEVMTTLEMGIDLFQGYFFSKPRLLPEINNVEIMRKVSTVSAKLKKERICSLSWNREQEELFHHLLDKILRAVCICSPGKFYQCLQGLCRNNPRIDCLYLLDRQGRQLGDTVSLSSQNNGKNHRLFHPAVSGTDHSLKEYYLSIQSGRSRFISSPYISLASGKLCITLSALFENRARRYVICADLRFQHREPID